MRNKAFAPDEVLLGALSAFWQRGFEGTNMPELLESMGVGRASFYNAFGSKRDVFLRVLNLYFETLDRHLTSSIADASNSYGAVASLIDGILNVARSAESNATGWRGCLIGNAALELGTHDREVVDHSGLASRFSGRNSEKHSHCLLLTGRNVRAPRLNAFPCISS